ECLGRSHQIQRDYYGDTVRFCARWYSCRNISAQMRQHRERGQWHGRLPLSRRDWFTRNRSRTSYRRDFETADDAGAETTRAAIGRDHKRQAPTRGAWRNVISSVEARNGGLDGDFAPVDWINLGYGAEHIREPG